MVTERVGGAWAAACATLRKDRDGAGLAVFRVLFGLLMCASALRFLAKGWVREIYVAPRFHFTYLGFSWVKPWPEPWMTLHLWALAVLAVLLALGCFTRVAAALYFLLFTYAELIEASAYLNHYYLVSLLSFLLIWLPSDAVWSVDVALRRRPARPVLFGHYLLVRAQIAIVYGFAGLAKLNGDWLLEALPLRIWLRAHADIPVVGQLLSAPLTAYVMSHAGVAFDLGIVVLLSWRRTRRLAWVLALVFHLAIALLFPVGVFSLVMLVCITLFNDPAWPRRWLTGSLVHQQQLAVSAPGSDLLSPWSVALSTAYLLVQLCLPLRYLAYPGPVNWTEEGFRFAWRVMLVEKTGSVEFRVKLQHGDRDIAVEPRRELTPLQARMMSTQPDMVHQFALHLAERWARQTRQRVEVRADAWVAFNGRRSQRFIDPDVDLAREPRGFGAAGWLLPLADQTITANNYGVPPPPSPP